MAYTRRVLDDLLDEMFPHMAAVAIQGAKGVGKSATALQRAQKSYELQDPAQRALLEAQPHQIDSGPFPLLIDEWQLYPPIWDFVKTSVDRDPAGGRFLLAGSADVPPGTRIHSGAGRIDRFTMRPMSWAERRVAEPVVSLAQLLRGDVDSVEGETAVGLEDYVHEIFRSGFPGIRDLPERVRAERLTSYVELIAHKEIPEQGSMVRNPDLMLSWLRAYGAASSTDASYEKIRDAATPGREVKPRKATVQHYRELLSRTFILEPLPAWTPSISPLRELTQSPKHHLLDPALAAHMEGVDPDGLLSGTASILTPDGSTWLGMLFESLVVQSVRVYAQAVGAKVRHLRTARGRQEIDIIVEDRWRNVVAIEVKLAAAPRDEDVKHLNWLQSKIDGHRKIARVVINAGDYAYRRADGVLVLPLALLGP
ncbi:ATP-binding protein [Nesterenkonia alba]|uniref:ATP-binding protein n=1 Tax=Nesterenkonia alba TaxID=515814 RepID=UPI0003B42B2B|nr:DUF4143 domain-containing protein [Nesterenkonia alba]